MKIKRSWWIGFSIMLTGLMAIALITAPKQPRYRGKTVSAWFDEYSAAFLPLALPAPFAPATTVFVKGPSNTPIRFVATNINRGSIGTVMFVPPRPDLPIAPFQSMGSNAVPFLVQTLRTKDRANGAQGIYRHIFVKSPVFLQRVLPAPKNHNQRRTAAVEILSQMRGSAEGAVPALLEVLQEKNLVSPLETSVRRALRYLMVEREKLHPVVLQLCQQSEFTRAAQLAEAFNIKEPAIAQALAEALKPASPSSARLEVLGQLGRMGEYAGLAASAIARCLKDSDKEIRYAAASALADIGPTARTAVPDLQRATEDKVLIVQNAAKRALVAIGSN